MIFPTIQIFKYDLRKKKHEKVSKWVILLHEYYGS